MYYTWRQVWDIKSHRDIESYCSEVIFFSESGEDKSHCSFWVGFDTLITLIFFFSLAELRQAIVAMMNRKDELTEQNT